MLEGVRRSLSVPLTESEQRRRRVTREARQYVEAFYALYLKDAEHEPYYRMSARR